MLHPSNIWLTIHESIGHPTELDRAMGYEANFAGTSFVTPPEKTLGQLRYGPPMMNIQGDRSQAGGLSTIGYDDDGVRPEDFLIIKDGILNDYQTTREQATLAQVVVRQAGTADRGRTAAATRRIGPTCSSSGCPTCRCSRGRKTIPGRI